MDKTNTNDYWIAYCDQCGGYIDQSDPQNFSIGKTVIIKPKEQCIYCTPEQESKLDHLPIGSY